MSDVTTVPVGGPDRPGGPYDVVIGEHVLERLPSMLGPGVRRVGVLAPPALAAQVAPVRRVLDRAGLEAAACECYRALADEYARLLGPAADVPAPTSRD